MRTRFERGRWIRWRADGVRFTYAPLPARAGPGRWALAEVTDPHGNVVTYEQECDATECYLASIAYADGPRRCGPWPDPSGWSALCPAAIEGARVRFHYEDRTDRISRGTGATVAVLSRRLRSIEVWMAGQLVRAYALAYEPSRADGASLLRSVEQFGSDAKVDDAGIVRAGPTPPLPPTVFDAASMREPPPGWDDAPPVPLDSVIGATGPGNPELRPGVRRA